MQIFRWGLLVLVMAMQGCATVIPDFGVRKEFWNDKTPTIGVAVIKPPKAASLQLGNQGLLDVLINKGNASDLDTHLGAMDITSINKVADNVASYLNQKGYKVKRIAEHIDPEKVKQVELQNDETKKIYYAKADYRDFKSQWGVDKVVVIAADAVGTMRSYYGFIPIGAPSGYARVSGVIVNLSNNQLEWKQTVTQTVPVNGDWDQPPSFPNLTSSVNIAYTQARDLLTNHFVQ